MMPPLSWARAFPGSPGQVRAARLFAGWLLAGSALCDDAIVVVSDSLNLSVCFFDPFCCF